jgi:integrase
MAQHKLNVVKVKTLDKPGRYGDGGGLYLIVDPLKSGRLTPTKRWSFRFMRNGKARETGLGGTEVVSLADARKKAQEIREQLAAGKDPVAENKKARATRTGVDETFGSLADAYIKSRAPGWKSDKHAAQWGMTLTVYAAALRDMRVSDIEVDDIVNVLEPIWQSKPETARRVRGRIEAVLDYARVRGFIDQHRRNPAQLRGNLDLVMAKQVKKPQHHKALPYSDLPAFMARLRLQNGVSARALEFTILTACRTGEVQGARWSEIDFDKALWRVPADRMKAGRDHEVPLTTRAVEILRELERISVDDFVFFGMKKNKGLSNMSLDAVLRRMKVDVTVHGFRSTFRDWVGEQTDYPRELAEFALAHVVGSKTERAYMRGTAFDKRRELMNDWCDYCGAEQNVSENGIDE